MKSNLAYKNRRGSDNRLVIIQICYQCAIVIFCLTCSCRELIKIEFILFGIIYNILNTMSFDVLLKTVKEFIYTFTN